MSTLQAETLLLFTKLSLLRPDWPGRLVLSVGLHPQGTALALAVLAAGGVCLTLEENTALLRAAGQSGATDFTVAGLGEALRILKNELRKRSSISVALQCHPATITAEMLHRGVQPDAVAIAPHMQQTPPLDAFVALGALGILLSAESGPVPSTLPSTRWRLAEDVAATPADRKLHDQAIAASLESADSGDPTQRLTLQWLRVAPRLFPRDRSRFYWRKDLP